MSSNEQYVVVPDIGTNDAVRVIEINVKVGDIVATDDPLITLESEKASMEIPSPFAGAVSSIAVNVGDSIKTGTKILVLKSSEKSDSVQESSAAHLDASLNIAKSLLSDSSLSHLPVESRKDNVLSLDPAGRLRDKKSDIHQSPTNSSNKLVYASPSIRRFANELGVDLTKVVGSDRKNRIVRSDVEQYVKNSLAKITQSDGATSNFPGLLPLPNVDFAKFGEISIKPLSRIKKISADNVHRNWVMVPHVTQFDEADITDMEGFRDKYKAQAEAKGYKLTPLVFLMKAATQALKAMPQFNASLSNDGVNVIYKHYYHIGVAVDTPNGLVVPVIKDVDQKGLFQLAQELADVSQKARNGKLLPKDMQGSCFTISSLGGIGGTGFTPIVNLPDVAILGVSKAKIKPVYQDSEFVPRLMLPLSLSYDHRVIDGADGARFITQFSQLLGDISQLLL